MHPKQESSMSYLDIPFVFFLEEAGCYLVSSVTTAQAFQLLWWEIRQTCILLTTHPNTPQRENRAGGGKLCCLPRGTVLNGLYFCLSACSRISHSEFGEAKPTTCLKAIVPKKHKGVRQMSLKYCPQTSKSACYQGRLPLPPQLWLSKQEDVVTCRVVLALRSERISGHYSRAWQNSHFSIFSSPVCTASAA